MTIGCTVIFVLLARGISIQKVFHWDTTLFQTVRSVSNGRLTRFALAVTKLGTLQFQFLCLVGGSVIYLWFRRIGEPILLFLCLSGVWGINVALKAVFHRERPILDPYLMVGGYSFPSGHTMSSMAFYGMAGYLLWQTLRRRIKLAWVIPILTSIIVLTIGWSRIYLGVHYASDVVAGFAAGGIWLIICLAGTYQWRNFRAPSS